MMMVGDRSLASQEIRSLLEDKVINGPIDENRIQPSSLDPIIGDELFILDADKGLFRLDKGETVYRRLLSLPKRQRIKETISEGFEIKTGYSYLIPLVEKLAANNVFNVRSSPKSSLGRLFLDTRLVTDYNNSFDEFNYQKSLNKDIDMWLLVQPLPFNVIIHPGNTLNQLRFLNNYNSRLTSREIADVLPILWKRTDGVDIPAEHVITDGLEIHLDLSGINTSGITGLRARKNPAPIDLNMNGHYMAEDYFEPVKGSELIIRPGEYYLFASSEILKIPDNLNVEMRANSNLGFHGPLHFAGFIDNGFQGDLVFEVRSDESSNIILNHDMPVSKLDFFRTDTPDKLYGTDSGSNYQFQIGPKPAKFFKSFDFEFAAKNYKKLDRNVLVQDAKELLSHRRMKEGFEIIDPRTALKLFDSINNGFFQSRYDCEYDELILQPIPYVLLFGPNDKIFSYTRAENIRDYGDSRLFGKYSVGLGGHVNIEDAPEYIESCIRREVFKEEVRVTGKISKPMLVGTLMAYDTPVDRVHLGLIFKIHTTGDVVPAESSITFGEMKDLKLLKDNISYYETWSKVLIPHLEKIYNYR